MKNQIKKFWNNESGAEVTELGIVLALVVAASVVLLAAIGPKIKKGYQDVKTETDKI